jgi:hypothetical protein
VYKISGAISALCASVPHRSPYFFLTRRKCDSHQKRFHLQHRQQLELEFTMSEDLNTAAAESAQRQVRVQLTSQQEDIALPESTGPILVPTGKRPIADQVFQLEVSSTNLVSKRSSPICAVDTGKQPSLERKANPIRVFDQWSIFADLHR